MQGQLKKCMGGFSQHFSFKKKKQKLNKNIKNKIWRLIEHLIKRASSDEVKKQET